MSNENDSSMRIMQRWVGVVDVIDGDSVYVTIYDSKDSDESDNVEFSSEFFSGSVISVGSEFELIAGVAVNSDGSLSEVLRHRMIEHADDEFDMSYESFEIRERLR